MNSLAIVTKCVEVGKNAFNCRLHTGDISNPLLVLHTYCKERSVNWTPYTDCYTSLGDTLSNISSEKYWHEDELGLEWINGLDHFVEEWIQSTYVNEGKYQDLVPRNLTIFLPALASGLVAWRHEGSMLGKAALWTMTACSFGLAYMTYFGDGRIK